ncbi:MAG: CDP-alcohol phosphatidyltransferase family protein [Candidatus Lokiarchaeota archaeon]|nr:CDP-alcohol phosphatidyltransferase family protein [Candidatus Lokiarchaeota archaeon]
MIDKWLSRTKFKENYEKFIRRILQNRISANQLTVLGLVTGLIGAVCAYSSCIYIDFTGLFIAFSLTFTIISFVIDTMDGPIARIEGYTIFGGILDIFCDRLVEVSIIIAIVATDPSNLSIPGVFSLAAIVLCTSMVLIVGGVMKRNESGKTSKVMMYQSGLIERSETFLFLIALILLIPWLFEILWIFAVLVFLTALLRLKDAHKIFALEEK